MAYLSQDKIPNKAIQTALIESITYGTFVDTVYYVYSRRLGGGKVGGAVPIYASSSVLKAAGEYFRAQLDGGFATDQNILDDIDAYVDECASGLEDEEEFDKAFMKPAHRQACGSSKGKNASIRSKPELSPEPFVHPPGVRFKYGVVVPDVAANTWRAIISYIYTGRVDFAPLRSEGHDFRAQAIEKHRTEGRVVPCSPKSMYRLADIVGMESLKKLAERGIRARISARTVVEEVFSVFSSTYPELLDYQINFLCNDKVSSQTRPAVREKWKAIVQGRLPHAEGVLETLYTKLTSRASSSESVGWPLARSWSPKPERDIGEDDVLWGGEDDAL